jgi:hypothetical protein
MSWAAASATPAGSDTQVQYNNGGTAFGAASTFTFNNSTGVVSATGFTGAHNGTVGATTPTTGVFTTATAQAAATQDSVVLQGRAGGTSSYAVTITPTTLTGNKTLTLPDATGTILQSGTAVTVAQGGTGLTAGTSGGVPYYSGTSAITSSALLTQYGVVYGGGAGNAPVATAAGTTGQFLGANTSGAPTWQTPAAKILQVVTTNLSAYASTTSTTFVDAGNLSVSITPTTSTNKILVLVTLNGCGTATGATGVFNIQLTDGSNNQLALLCNTTAPLASPTQNIGVSLNYLHSPASTSAQTYKIRFKGDSGVYGATIGNYSTTSFSNSSITVMEVVA